MVAQSAPADFEQADDFLSYDGIVAESPAEARFDSTIDADEGASYTRSGGAPYIGAGSPESLTGQPYDEPRAIVFMLGALLHHALTGKPLFTAGTNYIMEVMQWNISQLDPNVLGSWYGFLCRALNPDPSARFENPTEFVAEMNAIARHDEMIGDAKELYRLLSSAGLNVRLAAVRAVAEHASLQFVNVNTLGPNTIWVDDHGVHFGGPPAPPKKKPFWKR